MNILRQILLLLFLLILQVSANPALQLIEIAENKGFGYKTANLTLLKNVCERFNVAKDVNDLSLEVPAFAGISSMVLVDLLQQKANFDLRAKWSGVINQESDIGLQPHKDFLSNLSRAFDVMVDACAAEDLNDLFRTNGLNELFINQDDRFMVRSTGKEDKKDLANAGGNESVANVKPNRQSLFTAMKTVVLSYFEEKSLKQRARAGDTSVFSGEAFIPVLVQKMIGEMATDTDNPPRCGVMFTEEPEGRSKQPGVTSGITLIQAAYGHNEGVVNSIVPVDTYYVIASGVDAWSIYPVIREKTQRLVPMDDGSRVLVKQFNAKDLECISSLTRQHVITLKKCAQALEEFYGYPMDVEFVIKDNKIYIVQARPIVHSKKSINSTYLAEATLKTAPVIKGSSIVAAGSAVHKITDKSVVLCSSTIGDALNSYLALTKKDADKISCIITGTMAPSTSHEATTFRCEGKVVFYTQNLDEVTAALDAGKQLIVSPQQGVIMVVDDAIRITVMPGWYSYPIARELSLENEFFEQQEVVREIQEAAFNRKVTTSWSGLIQRMKIGTIDQVAQVSAEFLARLQIVYTQLKTKVFALDDDLEMQNAVLLRTAKVLCNDVVRLSVIDVRDPLYIKRLLPIRMLEALTFQYQEAEDLIHDYSIARTFGAMTRESLQQESSAAQLKGSAVAPLYAQLTQVKKIIFINDLEIKWDDFLMLLTQDPANETNLKLFGNFVAKLDKLGLLSLWLHTTFARANFAGLNRSQVLMLIKTWVKETLAGSGLMALMQEKRKEINSLTESNFSDPKKFAAAWKVLSELVDWFTSDDFKQQLLPDEKFAFYAACCVMNSLVTKFDLSIKVLKGSSLWESDKKVTHFATMIKKYFVLFESWLPMLPVGSIAYHPEFGVDKYLGVMRAVVDRENFTEGDLKPTPGYSGAPATIGSGILISDREGDSALKPSTFEDVFSVIHQSLTVVINRLLQHYGGNELELPTLLKDTVSMLENAVTESMDKSVFLNLLGTEINHQTLTLHYNLPLRNHSCQFLLQFNKKSNTVDLTVKFYGHTPNRWIHIAGFAELMRTVGISSIKDIKADRNLVSFTYIINDQSDHVTLKKTILEIIDFTMLETATIDAPVLRLQLVSEVINATNIERAQRLIAQKINTKPSIEVISAAYLLMLRSLDLKIISNEYFIKRVTKLGTIALAHDNQQIRYYGTQLFLFVLNSQGGLSVMDEVFNKTQRCYQNASDIHVSVACLDVFKNITLAAYKILQSLRLTNEVRLAIKQRLDAIYMMVEQALKSENSTMILVGLNMLNVFIEKDYFLRQGLLESRQTLKDSRVHEILDAIIMKSNYEKVVEKILDILLLLEQKYKTHKYQAKAAAEVIRKFNNTQLIIKSLKIFNNLTFNNLHCLEAVTALFNVKATEQKITEEKQNLLGDLLDSANALIQSSKADQETNKTDDYMGLEVFMEFVRHNVYVDEAKQAALSIISKQDASESAKTLGRELLQKASPLAIEWKGAAD